jgi:hypothetical protein
MDTEAIASEIVSIRQRLNALEADEAGSVDTDVDAERKELHERMRILQDQLSDSGPEAERRHTPADEVQHIPPA